MKKIVLVVGVVFAALVGSCLLCGGLAALSDDGKQAATREASSSPAALDGRYGCFQVQSAIAPNGQLAPRWNPVPVPAFNIEGNTYSDSNTSGAIEVANGIITFTGGSLDGWRGRLGADSKPFIAIAGENHREVTDRTGNGWNDFKCYVQKD